MAIIIKIVDVINHTQGPLGEYRSYHYDNHTP